jgi:hypothetical protein
MPYLTEHKQKFDDLRIALHEENRTQLKRTANGGNTVLFVYLPTEEEEYIAKAKEMYPSGHFVDVGELMVKSIDSVGLNDFKEFYRSHISTPDVVFTNEDPSSLFSLIINEICAASQHGKTTFLIHTGALEGTGIENVNIMEHKSVMSQGIPLVIFYPATYKNDDLLFLNHKPASKYRCELVK